jgi:hypothetical protein
MVNMSRVRCVERRRSKSEMGIVMVVDETLLIDVDAVSRDNRSLVVVSVHCAKEKKLLSPRG